MKDFSRTTQLYLKGILAVLSKESLSILRSLTTHSRPPRYLIVVGGLILFGALFAMTAEPLRSANRSTLPAGASPLRWEIPPGFPPPVYTFASNPLSKEGFEFGRRLFYEGRLSKDEKFPCSSCHQQFAGFATYAHDLSHGFNDQFTTRNTPGLANLAWSPSFHWDGGINHLEVQPLAPLTAPNEMAESLENVLFKLNQDPEYRRMNAAAFGTPEITSQSMLKALTQFMGMMVSANSRYDQMKRGDIDFTPEEQHGYEIFRDRCATCHPEPLFTDHSFRYTGMGVTSRDSDLGRQRITNDRSDAYKFKVPSLRNVELTGPYAHNGRFQTLSSVLDHYRFRIGNDPLVDPVLTGGIPLDEAQKRDIITFLRALTDRDFVSNENFRDPAHSIKCGADPIRCNSGPHKMELHR
jgi:cytochrome c peroxidase